MKYLLLPFLIVFSSWGHGSADGCLVKCTTSTADYRIPCGEFKITCKEHKRRQAPAHIIHQVKRDLNENIGSLLTPQEYKILERARKLLEVCAK